MKISLIRTLAIATLATSISAFAATDEPKHNDMTTTTASKQAGCGDRAGEGKKQKKAKPQRDQQNDNEKEFDRALLGIYG